LKKNLYLGFIEKKHLKIEINNLLELLYNSKEVINGKVLPFTLKDFFPLTAILYNSPNKPVF
jgi:hypothetical protein